MAHSKLARTTMLDWIEQCFAGGTALPTDAQIMDRYSFTSFEQARTLLADLADAGRITIRGYGDSRTIALGRAKATPTAIAAPIARTVKRADPAVDVATARIAAIVARTAKAAAAPTAPKPERVWRVRAWAPNAAKPELAKQEQPAASARREEPMSVSKSITFVATGDLLAEIKRRTADGTSNNQAVLGILHEAMQPPAAIAGKAAAPPPLTVDGIIDDVRALFAGMSQRLDQTAELEVAVERAEAAEERRHSAEARADAAEAKLAQAKALFA